MDRSDKKWWKKFQRDKSAHRKNINPLILESLEPRVLLSVDLYISSISTSSFSGIPGDTVDLTMSGIGNSGNDYVNSFQADVQWYLSPDSDPYGTIYPLWSGTTPWNIPGFTSGGSFTVTGTIPTVAPGQYYLVAMLNGDFLPLETNWANNYIVFDDLATIHKADDHGNTYATATSIPNNTSTTQGPRAIFHTPLKPTNSKLLIQ